MGRMATVWPLSASTAGRTAIGSVEARLALGVAPVGKGVSLGTGAGRSGQ